MRLKWTAATGTRMSGTWVSRGRVSGTCVSGTLVLISLVAALLAACTPVANCAKKTVLLSFEGEASEIRDVWIPIKTMYEKLNPGIVIELWPNVLIDKLVTQMAAGKPPDLWQATGYQAVGVGLSGLATDISPLVKKDKDFRLEVLHKGAVDGYRFKGKLYGLPAQFYTTGIWVNKTALGKAGLPVPPRSWTWADYELYCKKLTLDTNGDGRPERFGASMLTSWGRGMEFDLPWVNSAGGRVTDDLANPQKIDFTSDGTRAAMSFLKKLMDLKLIMRGYYADFQTGKAAMTPYYPIGQRLTAAIAKKFEYDVAYLPIGPKGSINNLVSVGFLLPKNAPHPVEAWRFLKWLVTEGHLNQNFIPAATKFRTEKLWPPKSVDPFNPDPFMDAADTALQNPNFPSYYDVLAPWTQASDYFMSGKKGYEQAFGPAEKEAQAILTRVLKRYSK